MAKRIYMEVTMDALQLPLIVADSARELSRLTGVHESKIYESAWRGKSGKAKCPRFVSVEIEEESE